MQGLPSRVPFICSRVMALFYPSLSEQAILCLYPCQSWSGEAFYYVTKGTNNKATTHETSCSHTQGRLRQGTILSPISSKVRPIFHHSSTQQLFLLSKINCRKEDKYPCSHRPEFPLSGIPRRSLLPSRSPVPENMLGMGEDDTDRNGKGLDFNPGTDFEL